MRRLVLLAALACSLSAQEKKRIFVITDAEGIAGVCHQDQTDPKDAGMRELLTGEINAAVDGFFEGGADEVIVWDGHGGATNLSAATIHPRAKLIMGPLTILMTLDRKYTAVAFVGQHAMANVPNAIMAHSYSSLGIQNMKLNGKPVGEIETRAALAGYFGSPVIFLSGDSAAARELLAIVPQAETAVVKEGLLRNTCETLSAGAARALIREKARAAMAKIGRIPPYRVDGAATLEIEYTTRNSLSPDARLIRGAEVVDDRTIRYRAESFVEAWKMFRLSR